MGLFDKESERDEDVEQVFFVTNANFESRDIGWCSVRMLTSIGFSVKMARAFASGIELLGKRNRIR